MGTPWHIGVPLAAAVRDSAPAHQRSSAASTVWQLDLLQLHLSITLDAASTAQLSRHARTELSPRHSHADAGRGVASGAAISCGGRGRGKGGR